MNNLAVSGKIIDDNSSNVATIPIYLNSNGQLTDATLRLKRESHEWSQTISSFVSKNRTSSNIKVQTYNINLPYAVSFYSFWILLIRVIGSESGNYIDMDSNRVICLYGFGNFVRGFGSRSKTNKDIKPYFNFTNSYTASSTGGNATGIYPSPYGFNLKSDNKTLEFEQAFSGNNRLLETGDKLNCQLCSISLD